MAARELHVLERVSACSCAPSQRGVHIFRNAQTRPRVNERAVTQRDPGLLRRESRNGDAARRPPHVINRNRRLTLTGKIKAEESRSSGDPFFDGDSEERSRAALLGSWRILGMQIAQTGDDGSQGGAARLPSLPRKPAR